MVGYCFYISKFIDFLDTIFFVLRKKNNQITFLHLFHHGIMPLSVWPCFRFIGGGHAVFLLTFNTFVHFVMYFYYLISAMGPAFRKYLWWKRYLTVFQMFQFVCVTLHSSQLIVFECDFPIAYFWWAVTQAVAFFLLFKNYHSGVYSQNLKEVTSLRTTSPMRVKKYIWSNNKRIMSYDDKCLNKQKSSSSAFKQLIKREVVAYTNRRASSVECLIWK